MSEFSELIKEYLDEQAGMMHTAILGKVTTVENGKANVQPAGDYPLLINLPIITDCAKGDRVLVVFQERNLSKGVVAGNFDGIAEGMEIHDNTYHDPDFATESYVDESTFSGSYDDLSNVPNEFTPESHDNLKHTEDYITDTQEHDNAKHTENYITDTQDHDNLKHTENYITDTQEHGNDKHTKAFTYSDQERKIHVSTQEPTEEDGEDGDLWFKYEE